MGSTGSVDRKAGVTEVMMNEGLASPPPAAVPQDSTKAQGSSFSSNPSSGNSRMQQPDPISARHVSIRRKNPSSRGHSRQGSTGSNGGAVNTPTKRKIKLFEGDGPVTQWKKGNLVGKGATGAVYEAVEQATNGVFCVKEIEFTDDFADNPHDMQRFESLRREIELLKDIHHPNVVRFLGVDRVNFIIYIQMEYVYGGNIQDIVRNFGPLGEDTAGKFTLQILDGLDYLHDKGIIHRDIKGANILVGVNGEVKLADFGAAKRVLDHEELFKTLAGTPYWMAPEVVRQEGHNKAADVWSLGATVLQMLTGSAPYQALPPVPALFKIGHCNESPVPAEIPKASPDAVDFIRRCLTREASKRPSLKQLLQHPWIGRQRMIREEKMMARSRREQSKLQEADSARTAELGGAANTASVNKPAMAPPVRGPLSSAISACSDAEMLTQNYEIVEQGIADEELQIKEFVEFVSERHRALQREQHTQCKEAIEDVVEVRHRRYDSPPSSPRSVDSLGNPVEKPQEHGTASAGQHHAQPPEAPRAAHRLSSDDDDDDRLPPIGATLVRSSSSNALSSPVDGTGGVQKRGGHATMVVVEHPNAHDDEDEAGGDVVFEDEFDEAHFDEIIAGLGDVRTAAC